MNCTFFILLLALLLSACDVHTPVEVAEAKKDLPDEIDFNFHVKPILSDKCYACHGPDQASQKAGLRLDTPEGAYAELKETPGEFAIVSGSLSKSQAYQRIISKDENTVMPPPESNLSLTPSEIAVINKWIEKGAQYKRHWSFIAPQQQVLPKVKNKEWVKGPIDHFVLSQLEKRSIEPNKMADKETLIRRVTLDLTGLPPSIDEIDNFLADDSQNAYEKVVDRLLASPHYGERMALEWLDVARYADSHGYSTDGYRLMWPWRDWVIKSFNENMPFDQFIIWQIAGDKFPNATKEQRLATAFLRNQKLNAEGGIVQEEYLVEYAADRTETVSTAFLGMTVQCAKCHDHKYDPISQKEYFELFAFFNSVNEKGMTQNDGNSGPQVLLTSKEVEDKIAFINEKIEEGKRRLVEVKKSVEPKAYQNPSFDFKKDLLVDISFEKSKGGRVFDQTNSGVSYSMWRPTSASHGKNGKGFKFSGHDIVSIEDERLNFDRSDAFSFSFWLNANYQNQYMPVIFNLRGKNSGYKGYEIAVIDGYLTLRLVNGLPANLISVRQKEKLVKNEWKYFTFTYDGSGSATGVSIYESGRKVKPQILFDNLIKSFKTWKTTVKIGGRQDYQVRVEGDGMIDDFKIYGRQLSDLEAYALFEKSAVNTIDFSDESLLNHYLLTSSDKEKIRDSLKELRKEKNQMLDTISAVMVMQDLPEPRPTYVLNRGAYDAPGEQVQPNTPESIFDFPDYLSKDRMGLAKWLVDKGNPLPARVLVNRYWQMYFGQGIVKTVEDFGNQGSLPHHPALLDYLGSAFVDSGWDLKKLHKSITMSATYRQSSRVSEEQRKSDPENTLLARGPNHRLQAEFIRDCALKASGLLVDEIGGASVKPYQPDGLWKEITGNSRILNRYKIDEGKGLYRRSLYTFWRRTSPPPTMVVFDAPSRDYCIVRREETNTPLQALSLLNDPQFVEASRVLADKVVHSRSNLDEQIKLVYRSLTGLMPDEETQRLLKKHYDEQRSEFEAHPEMAKELLKIGQSQSHDSLLINEVAAMAVVCNTIMSFDETIVKR